MNDNERLEALRAELRELYRQKRADECCVGADVIDRIDAIATEIADILNRQCAQALALGSSELNYPGAPGY